MDGAESCAGEHTSDTDPAVLSRVEDRVRAQLGPVTEKLTRVKVHLRDDNSASKSSPDDKRCVMEARIARRRPLAVEHSGGDLRSAPR